MQVKIYSEYAIGRKRYKRWKWKDGNAKSEGKSEGQI
jgi:hypothetical protein